MGFGTRLFKIVKKIAARIHRPPKGYAVEYLPRLVEIADSIPCGSVLLCSGTSAESRLIEEVDGTDFSHSAMVVSFQGSPQLYLWTADTFDRLDDCIDKLLEKKHAGTHLLKLEDYIAAQDVCFPSKDGSQYRFAIARLTGVSVDERKLQRIMYQYDGTPFPSTEEEFKNWVKGRLDIDSGLNSAFCAQMLAITYQKMGWLKVLHPPNHYGPGYFAKTEKVNKALQGGAKLAPPQYFKL